MIFGDEEFRRLTVRSGRRCLLVKQGSLLLIPRQALAFGLLILRESDSGPAFLNCSIQLLGDDLPRDVEGPETTNRGDVLRRH